MAHFNVYRSRGGYGFEVTHPDGRIRGWRPTRGWAKKTAQREALDVLEIDPEVQPTFRSNIHDRPIKTSGPKRSSHRSRRNRQRVLFVGAAAIVLVALVVGAVVFLKGRKTTTTTAAVPSTISIYANARLKTVLPTLTNDFHIHNPSVTVNIVWGSSQNFEQRAKANDLADVYIDAPASFGWITGYVAPDGSESQLGFDVLELIVRAGNPKKVQDLKSLSSDTTLKVGFCAPNQLCGMVTQQMFKLGQIKPPATPAYAPDANTIIGKVAQGQVDVAVVFRTDYSLHPAPGLAEITIDKPLDSRLDYEIRRGKKTSASQTFLDYVKSVDGANKLHAVGLLSD